MCARLTRIFETIYGHKPVTAFGPLKSTPNYYAEDSEFIQECMAQHCPDHNISRESTQTDDERCTSDPRSAELMQTLISAEQFMRSSVNWMEILRAVEPDTRPFIRPSQPALDWVRHALDTAMRIQQLFIENERLYNTIAQQGIRLPPALAKFVELISLILSTYHLWARRRDNHWIWPDAATTDYSQNWHEYCPYVDLVREIEEIQLLLDKQNASSDRLRNSNFATACALVDEAFVFSSKVLVIRLDLGYTKGVHLLPPCKKNDADQSETHIDLDIFLAHLEKFLDVMKKIYGKYKLSHILKIEYGLQKGYHTHLLLLLNGRKHQKDISIARQLGEKWVSEITQGDGTYWNCNANKDRYRHKAIGMIHRSENIKINLLKSQVLTYLVKHDIPLEIFKQKPFRKFRPSHRKLK